MAILLLIIQAFCVLMALGLAVGFASSRHVGLLLASGTFGSAAIASYQLDAWWPLAASFVAAWLLRLIGLDPKPGVEH